MTVRPIRAGPGWWLDSAEDAPRALLASLRYAPAPLFCPMAALARDAGDPEDRRIPVLTPAAWAAVPTPWPADRPLAVALCLTASDAWPAADPRVRWWVVSPDQWAAARAAAAAAGATVLATGPVPDGPYLTTVAWALGDWLALDRPFADDDREEVDPPW